MTMAGSVRVMLRWSDVGGLRRFEEAIRALGNDTSRKVLARAVNRTGEMARTQVRSALTKQTGLKRKVIIAAVKTNRSDWEDLTFSLYSTGGDVSLKFFEPTETDEGVRAKPFNRSTVFPATFRRGGEWPGGRGALLAGGHAFFRAGTKRLPIERARSGVIIPAEMVKDASAEAFTSTAATVLPRRVEHEIKRVTKGVVS